MPGDCSQRKKGRGQQQRGHPFQPGQYATPRGQGDKEDQAGKRENAALPE